MSQPVRGEITAGAVPEPEDTGKFRIETASRASTVLPPAGEVEEVSLDALGAVLDAEAPEPAVEVGDSAPRVKVSGVFTNPPPVPQEASQLLDLPPALLSSARPYYPSQPVAADRAHIEIEDLSLRPDNPYSASSLVPPTEKPISARKLMVVAAVALAIGAAGVVVYMRVTATPLPSVRAPSKPAAQVVVQQPSGAVKAPVEELAAEPTRPALGPAPAQKAPAAVVAPEPVERPLPVAAASEAVRPTETPVHAQQAPAQIAAQAPAAPVAEAQAPTAAAGEAAPTAAAEPAPVAATEAPADAVLPEAPSREDIVAGFEKAREALSACAAGKHGVVKMETTIASSGRVANVLIDGVFKGTPEGSCMARAARAARFPQFSRPTLKVTYPVSL